MLSWQFILTITIALVANYLSSYIMGSRTVKCTNLGLLAHTKPEPLAYTRTYRDVRGHRHMELGQYFVDFANALFTLFNTAFAAAIFRVCGRNFITVIVHTTLHMAVLVASMIRFWLRIDKGYNFVEMFPFPAILLMVLYAMQCMLALYPSFFRYTLNCHQLAQYSMLHIVMGLLVFFIQVMNFSLQMCMLDINQILVEPPHPSEADYYLFHLIKPWPFPALALLYVLLILFLLLLPVYELKQARKDAMEIKPK